MGGPILSADGALTVQVAGHAAPLTWWQVDQVLGVLMDAGARDAYFALHDAYVAAGGIPYGNGGFSPRAVAA